MSRVLLFMFVLAITVYAVVDCLNADEEDRRGLPTGLWLILIIMLPIFGPVAWYLLSSSQRRARLAAGGSSSSSPHSSGAGYGRPAPRQRPARPVAPDDDPDFLWRLEQERRRAAREQNKNASESSDETQETAGSDEADGTDGTDGTPENPSATGSSSDPK